MKLGPLEIVLILVIILVVFGVGKLPQVGSALGKSIRAFREGQSGDDEVEEEEEEEEEEVKKPRRKATRKTTRKAKPAGTAAIEAEAVAKEKQPAPKASATKQ
jgi:sec-independent protein translocase protein TatA